MSESNNLTPRPTTDNVEMFLTGAAWDFFDAQTKSHEAEHNNLVEEGKTSQCEHERLSSRHLRFKPTARALNKQWFHKEGEEQTKRLAALMQGVEEAGGEVEYVEYVRRVFKDQMESVQEVKMSVAVLRGMVGQYQELV